MTEMSSYFVDENPNFEPCKPKKQYNPYSSLLPIISTIVTYILIFYILEVSPLSVFNDTKILFFISNALIIIIAADYGAFTDKESHDFYGEYTNAMRNHARRNPRPEIPSYEVSLTEEIKNREKQDRAVGAKNIIPQYLLNKEVEIPEKPVRVLSEKQPRDTAIENYEPTTEKSIHTSVVEVETSSARNLVNHKRYRRRKLDKVRRSTMLTTERCYQAIKHRPTSYDRRKSDRSKWMIVHKEKKAEEEQEMEEKWENVREESEEFSKLSNEELNKRVEDFIQRFNRDIKRQIFV